MTFLLELVFFGIIGLFVALRGVSTLPRLLTLAAAAWVAEDTVIHVYGFYAYSPQWSVMVDQVPLTVLLIWPVVILSAQDLAGRKAPWVVLTDAALIEPIAVLCGYWWWTEPGLFKVPLIGMAGWAVFAAWALWIERSPWARRLNRLAPLAVIVGAPILTHLSLLAMWWGALRWINVVVPPVAGVCVAVLVSAGMCWCVLKQPPSRRRDVMLRVPAATFFFGALAMADPGWELIVYASAFAPPYLVLTATSR